MVDVAAVPHRLEHPVAEAEHQQVLNRFFAQIVIDAVDLIFVEMLMREPIERPRAVQIGAERFLDDDAAPSTCGASASPEAPRCSMTVEYTVGGMAR